MVLLYMYFGIALFPVLISGFYFLFASREDEVLGTSVCIKQPRIELCVTVARSDATVNVFVS